MPLLCRPASCCFTLSFPPRLSSAALEEALKMQRAGRLAWAGEGQGWLQPFAHRAPIPAALGTDPPHRHVPRAIVTPRALSCLKCSWQWFHLTRIPALRGSKTAQPSPRGRTHRAGGHRNPAGFCIARPRVPVGASSLCCSAWPGRRWPSPCFRGLAQSAAVRCRTDWCSAHGSAGASPGHRAGIVGSSWWQRTREGLEEQKIRLLPPSPCPCPSRLSGVAGEGRGTHRRVPKL